MGPAAQLFPNIFDARDLSTQGDGIRGMGFGEREINQIDTHEKEFRKPGLRFGLESLY